MQVHEGSKENTEPPWGKSGTPQSVWGVLLYRMNERDTALPRHAQAPAPLREAGKMGEAPRPWWNAQTEADGGYSSGADHHTSCPQGRQNGMSGGLHFKLFWCLLSGARRHGARSAAHEPHETCDTDSAMRMTTLPFAILLVLGPSVAQAGVDVHINLNLPVAPPLVEVRPGIQVVEGCPEEVFFHDGWYWCRRPDGWYRARSPRDRFDWIQGRKVPKGLVREPLGHYKNWHRGGPGPRVASPGGPGGHHAKPKGGATPPLPPPMGQRGDEGQHR